MHNKNVHLNFFHHYPTNFELLFLTGAKIISSKAFCSLNFRTTSRNLSGELWSNPNFSYQSGNAIQGNETSIFPNALLLSHRDSMLSKAHYKVHVWHVLCILLGSAMSLLSCFVNRIRKMVSFELDKDIEKGCFFFAMGHAHPRVSVVQQEHWSVKSEGLMFTSSWEFRVCSLFHAFD